MSDKLDYNPTTFNRHNVSSLRLLRDSKDIGDGWRQVSEILWRGIVPHMPPELIEKDDAHLRVRLSDRGKIVMDYLA
jgi:hypothetical protein